MPKTGGNGKARKPEQTEAENDAQYKSVCKQRQLERKTRGYKTEADMLESAGDTEGAKAMRQKATAADKELKGYCNKEGLTYRSDRAQVYGYSAKKTVDNSAESGIINSGAISGALNPDSDEAQKHAETYYESVRHMTNDTNRIARNTGLNKSDIDKVKDFIFNHKHDLGGSELEYFYPNYEMSQSWQRLIDGKNIQKHDITLLNHETMERNLIKQGYTQEEAHRITELKYNYAKESEEYYAEIDKHYQK